MRVLIISGGQVDICQLKKYVKKNDYHRIIAADSGLAVCREAGVLPTEILGDFDSLKDPDLIEEYKKRGVPVRTFPERKDYTDTDLAMHHACGFEPEQMDVFGATGSRMDHTMANVFNLGFLAERGINCRLVDSHNQIEMLKGPCRMVYERQADLLFFSLLACSEKVKGLTLKGFSYPLEDFCLERFTSIGISNYLTEKEGILCFKEGFLLVVRSSD